MAQVADGIEREEFLCPGGMPAFMARPAGEGKHPIVILMHERYGLVQHTKDLAVRCARDGFFTVAPNFFFKHPDLAALNAGDSRYDLRDPESNTLLKSVLQMLADDPRADSTRVAVAGYCQTGRHPLVFAAEASISAAIVWYGAASKREWSVNELQPKPLEEIIARVDCPVFGCFGEADHIISLDDVVRFRNCLEANRKSYEIHMLAGAPHGWLNDTMPGRYRKAQAEAGWAAQQRFLTKVLGGGFKSDEVSWTFNCETGRNYDFSKNVRLE
ncbi:MAG: hypothetical protein RLZ98_678 [Pseudomonadota bacterium]|jgi:carboxymethylenebutenolidase